MLDDPKALTAELVAALCLEQVGRFGTLGVFVENMPPLDAAVFVGRVGQNVEKSIRIAVLGTSRFTMKAPKTVRLTTSPTEANRWRNDADSRMGMPFIALVTGSAPKLNSLRSAVPVLGPDHLRRALVQRAVALLDTPERRSFWHAISAGHTFPLSILLAYLAEVIAAAGKSHTILLETEPALVYLLGLLRQDGLFSSKGARSAGAMIQRNLDRVAKLRDIPSRDRVRVIKIVEQNPDSDPLKEAARSLLDFERSGLKVHLAHLSVEKVAEIFQKESGADSPTTKHKQRIDGDTLALELLLDAEGRGLKIAAKRFRHELEPDPEGEVEPEEIAVSGRKVLPRLRNGTRQAISAFARTLNDECWGGIVNARTSRDFVGGLKLLAADETEVIPFRPGDQDNVREMLNRAVDQAWVDRNVVRKWDAYVAVRGMLLPHLIELTDHPLMALAGNEALLGNCERMLSAFDDALGAVKETADALRDRGSIEPAKRLLARTIVLDLLFVRSMKEMNVIAGPTHPFHLWRWVTLAHLVRDRALELKELGEDALKNIIGEPPPVSPSVLLSPFVKDSGLDRSQPFICVGSFGALPLFSEPSSRHLGKFRAKALAKIAERLIRLMPHAAFGLKVVLIDPVSVSGALEELLDLDTPFGGGPTVKLQVTVYRTRVGLDATDEEDEELEEVARNIQDGSGSVSIVGGTFSLSQIAQRLADQPAHLVVAFDPGEGQELRLGVSAPPLLSPLIVPRAYKYDAFDDRLDVVIAGEGAPFMTYHTVFCETIDMPRSDFVGRRSGASRWSLELGELAKQSVWTVVVDQALEPTLRLGESLRLDWRSDGGRDFATFTMHPETVEELVAEAVRQAGLVPNQPTVTRAFKQICRLSGEALLLLARKAHGSLVDGRLAKGTLGVLAAARWYENTYPDALMISLDDPLSRRWVLGHTDSDNRHGDLLGVRLSNQGVVVECVEVKTYADATGGLTYHGASVEGEAATQVDQTIKILRKLLTIKNLPSLDRARQDILRDHLYRAVASRPYSREQRGRLVSLLVDLFQDGVEFVEGLIFTVTLASNSEEVSPISPKVFKTAAGNRLGVVELVETEVAMPSGERSTRVAPEASSEHARSMPEKAKRPKITKGGDSQTHPKVPNKGVTAEASEADKEGVSLISGSTAKDPKILIGESASGGQVFWEPHRSDSPLNNFGILVTGDSGSGKTQVLRALIDEVAQLGIPICVFDFKNDYAASGFSSEAGLRVYDVSRDGIPFNPLSLLPDEHGEAQPIIQVHHLAGILRRIFTLGDQQESRLKKAMALAYEEAGIEPKMRHKVAAVKSVPSFGDVIKILGEEPKNEPLLNRLSPLFDLGLFPSSDNEKTTFERLLAERVVLDLHSLPDDKIKAAVAEFMIVRLHSYVLTGDQPRMLRRLLVFDEAWRVKDSERLQELAREGRAFGVGIAIGTQFPGDIKEVLAGNLATQIFLHNKEADHQKVIARALCGTASGAVAAQIIAKISRLQKHEGFMKNQQYSPYVFVRTTPHYERR